MILIHYFVFGLIAALVGVLGARLCRYPNPTLGAGASVLLYITQPLVIYQGVFISAWDALCAVLFFTAWVWMDEWSLFMRSWILAGIYAFALWIGSAFIWWIPIAMLPWIAMSRRPTDSLVKLLTVILGGLALFGGVWLSARLLAPPHPPLPWQLSFRWGLPSCPAGHMLPFIALTAEAVLLKIRDAVNTRRSDGGLAIALVLGVTSLVGPSEVRLALIALACPLIAATLLRREFVYQRMVRWIMAYTFLLTIAVTVGKHALPGAVSITLILLSGCAIRWVQKSSILNWRESFEASCVGATLAVSIGSFLSQ